MSGQELLWGLLFTFVLGLGGFMVFLIIRGIRGWGELGLLACGWAILGFIGGYSKGGIGLALVAAIFSALFGTLICWGIVSRVGRSGLIDSARRSRRDR